MHRTLIVARMDPQHADAVSQVFAESDATELPHLVGVRHRSLFAFHGLYFHLIETEQKIAAPLAEVRSHPLFQDVDRRLARYVKPYDPATWREPKDAMATGFYSWKA